MSVSKTRPVAAGANSVPVRQVAAGKDERKASMTSAVSAPTALDSPARGLVCRACGAEYPLVAQHACYKCFGPLEVAYDQAALGRVTRQQIEAGPQNIWRYAGLLPAGQDPAT